VPTKTRPGWVWIICIWITSGFVIYALLGYLYFSGSWPLTAQAKASIPKFSTFDMVTGIVGPLLAESAAVALFLLRRQATYLFWSSLGVGIISNVHHFVLNDGIRSNSIWQGRSGILISIGTQLAFSVYCEHLKRKGTLT
jgi:hypothetical protein